MKSRRWAASSFRWESVRAERHTDTTADGWCSASFHSSNWSPEKETPLKTSMWVSVNRDWRHWKPLVMLLPFTEDSPKSGTNKLFRFCFFKYNPVKFWDLNVGEEEIRPPPVTGQDGRTGKQEDQNRLDQRVNSLWARKSTKVDVKRPNWVRVYKKQQPGMSFLY